MIHNKPQFLGAALVFGTAACGDDDIEDPVEQEIEDEVEEEVIEEVEEGT